MPECLGSHLCEHAPSMVTLEDGFVVCSSCPEWRKECEAKRLLTYPVVARAEAFREREKIRGAEATYDLKGMVEKLRAKQAELRRKKAEQWLR
ncbi:hypothetical protein EBT16_04095 [bacterium]|nr:hypothetical protein [bacterium]